MSFPIDVLLNGQEQYWADQTQQHDLGARGYMPDGRSYRYVLLGTSASANDYAKDVGRGLFAYNPPVALTVTIGGIGDTEVTGTVSGARSTDDLAGGFLGSFTSTYRHLMSGIKSNTSGTTPVIQLERALEVSIVAATTYVVADAYHKVCNLNYSRDAGDFFEFIPGVCIAKQDKDGTAMASGDYTWIQSWGVCLCIIANDWEGASALEKMVRFDGAGVCQTIPNGATYDNYAHSQIAGYQFPSTAAVPGVTGTGSNLVRTSNFIYLMITP